MSGTDALLLTNQIAIVTGSGSGIGAATARILGARGARLVLADRDAASVTAVAEELQSQGIDAVAVPTDISDELSVAELVSAARARGPIAVLVNSAGITGPLGRKTHELDIEAFDSTLAVNLRGAILLTMGVLPDMLEAQYGRIMQVVSIAGKEGNPGMAPYNSAKAGLIGFVKGCAKEYATSGITVNAIAPAVIRGPMAEGEPPAVIEYMLSRIPMRRMGEPIEVAEVIAFAVSPACTFTTGFVFDATGGRATY